MQDVTMDISPIKEPKIPLSAVHGMMATIRRERHARNLNRLLNHPSVYPWVHGPTEGPLDLTGAVLNPNNVLLMGQFGGLLFQQHQQGLYEVHSQCYPEGRGEWMVGFVKSCLMWMFTRSDAVEIMTRCPKGNYAARALAKTIGGRYEFTNPRGWVKDGQTISADIFALRIQDWMRTAPGLEERGRWFHDLLEGEYERLGKAEPQHPDDPGHDRYVGAACEMILGGQPDKAVIFYNRWAMLADYATIRIASRSPLALDIRESILIVRPDGQFYVAALTNQTAPTLN
jgi:hypothetical protein